MPDGLNLAGPGQALDVSLPTIITDFKLLRDVTGVFRDSADGQTLKAHTGVSWIRNNYGRAVAYNLDEAADMTQGQTLSDAATTITPGEVGAQIVLPGSTLRRVQDASLESRVATMLNNAYNLKEDQDGAAQMASWTGASLGSTGVILAVGSIFAGAALLGVGKSIPAPEPAPEPIIYVGHDFQLLHLMGRLMVLTDVPAGTNTYTGITATGAAFGPGHTSGMSDTILAGGVGKLTTMGGVTIKKDANLPVINTADARGGMFSKMGLLYVNELEPRIRLDTSDVSMRDAVEVNVWGSYGYGLYRPGNYGLAMLFDATTPTG